MEFLIEFLGDMLGELLGERLRRLYIRSRPGYAFAILCILVGVLVFAAGLLLRGQYWKGTALMLFALLVFALFMGSMQKRRKRD